MFVGGVISRYILRRKGKTRRHERARASNHRRCDLLSPMIDCWYATYQMCPLYFVSVPSSYIKTFSKHCILDRRKIEKISALMVIGNN